VSVSEAITATDVVLNTALYLAFISEGLLAVDVVAGRLLWEVINDSQSAGWATINDNQSTTWQNVSTSVDAGWNVIPTQE
jgi:hypothetical protein